MTAPQTGLVHDLVPFVAALPQPVQTALGVVQERRGFYVDVEVDGGRGRGEATPLPAFGTESLEVCERVLRGGGDGDTFAPCARHALEQARMQATGDVVRALARAAGVDVDAPLLSAPVASHTLCTADVHNVLRLVESGVRTIKVKVFDPERARHFVRHLRTKVSGERLAVRLDANGCLDALSSRWLLRNLGPGDVELIEQPVDRDDLDGLRSLARDFPHVIVCADESLIDPAMREALLAAPENLGFIWKPQAVGGALAVLDAVKRRRDRLHVVTGFLDTPVAHTYAAACASVVDALCGVARAHGLTSMARLG